MVLLNRKHVTPKNGADGYWRVYLYRYGELYKILSVAKGSRVTLVTCPSPYSDDTFYGWSKDPQDTTRAYAPTGSFLPTADMNLYAIYSYKMNSQVQKSVSEQVDIGGKSATLTVTDATPGTPYKVYTGSGSISQGSSSSAGSYSYYPIISMSWSLKTSGTAASNGTITYAFAAGGTTTKEVLVGGGSVNEGVVVTRTPITVNDQGKIDYVKTETVSGTFYRVVSHDNPSVINVYSYGVLKKTLSVMEGQGIVLGSVSPAYSDDTFYGYSTSASSTSRTYQSTSKITPHGVLNLYAIYSYQSKEETTEQREVSVATGKSATYESTTSASGTLKCCIKVIVGSSSGASISYDTNQSSANFTGAGAYVTYNGSRLAITSSHTESNQFSTSVTAGKVFKCILRAPSSGNTLVIFTCPHYEYITRYRVVSHP